jgi:signal transduction histidine kinase
MRAGREPRLDADPLMTDNSDGRYGVADVGAGKGSSEGVDPAQRESQRLQEEIVQLRRSRARLLLSADGDRRAIERALHEGLQQQLVALAVNLGRVAGLVDEDPVAAKALLDELRADVRDGIDEAARLAQRIYPYRLHDVRGLASALRSAADRADVAVTIRVSAGAGHTPESIARIYWCCAEALSAAPAGTQATIGVVDAAGGLQFEVEVAGGYPEERLERLRDRVEAMGGRVTIEDLGDDASRVAGTVPSAWT